MTPFKDFFLHYDQIFICAKDGGEWEELPTLSDTISTVAPKPDADITPPNINLSFTATMSGEFPRDLLFPRTKLPRKLKKATKTLYFERKRRSFTIRVNPTPKTKWQRKIARKCACGEIMTPKGEILEIKLQ